MTTKSFLDEVRCRGFEFTRMGRTSALLLTLACGAAIAAGAPSCGSSDDNGGETPPCSTVYQGLCGSTCTTDADCGPGIYCGPDGTCTADCEPTNVPCPNGGTCSDKGRCESGPMSGSGGDTFTGSGGAGPGSGASSGQGGSCGAVDIQFAPQIPTVLLLIDQSGSMTTQFQGQQRWDVVYDVLMDPNDGVVKALEGIVRFGMVLYSYGSGTCPELVTVNPPALNNHATIDAVYSQEGPYSNTPTGDSITAITPDLAAFAEPGPKVIILATDGDPDRCEDPDGHDQVSKNEVIAATQAAYTQSIETVVIAVGDEVSNIHQQDVANAGKGKQSPAPNPCDQIADPANCAKTYEPATKQEMIDAFNEIILGTRTCVFTLDGQVIPGKECDGTVTVNGQPIGCNDPNGWKLNSPTEIEFVGAACDTILNDPQVEVEASFPCDAVESGSGPA